MFVCGRNHNKTLQLIWAISDVSIIVGFNSFFCYLFISKLRIMTSHIQLPMYEKNRTLQIVRKNTILSVLASLSTILSISIGFITNQLWLQQLDIVINTYVMVAMFSFREYVFFFIHLNFSLRHL